MSQKNHLAAAFDCRTIIVSYYISFHLACAYNIEDLYHTGRSNQSGMEKSVYIVRAYYKYTVCIHGYYIHIKHGRGKHCD